MISPTIKTNDVPQLYSKLYYQKNCDKIKQYSKQYHQKNKEYRKKYYRKYYEQNIAKIKRKNKEHCKNNSGKVKEMKKLYLQQNSDEIKRKQKIYRQRNKNKIKQYRRKHYRKYIKKYKQESRKYYRKNKQYIRQQEIKHPFRRLASNANFRYKDSKITPFDLWKIAKKQKLRCALTNEKLTLENISLDHVIPKSKGGLNIISNLRLILHPINIARQNMTDERFVNMCKSVVDYSRWKNL